MKYKPNNEFEAYDNVLTKTGFFIFNNAVNTNNITDTNLLISGERISSLARPKNAIETILPHMDCMDLLKLKFNRIPVDKFQKSRYLLKTIQKYFNAFLIQHSERKAFVEKGLPFILESIGLYREHIEISIPTQEECYGPGIACSAFKGNTSIMIKVREFPDFIGFGVTNGTRKRNSGYYQYKKIPTSEVYLIDFPLLISYLSLNNCLFQLAQQNISLVNSYFQKYIDMEYYSLSRTLSMFKDVLIDKKPIDIKHLFSTYLNNASELKLRFSPDTVSYSALSCVFFDILSIYQDLKYESNFRKNLNKQIATAYITKKNIPLYITAAMKESCFNNYFGYVEFDKDVDLSAVKTIEKEFKLLNKAYFSSLSFHNVKLRFRKLGKHRAGGLYYPGIKTLCVDIHAPNSFIHEYFHMLDDQLGDISFDNSFNTIINLYKNCFLEGLNSLDEKTQNKLKGSSTYNVSYFFRRAEIFARCGEIYLMRILNVKSSLLKPESTFAYPSSQELDHLIQIYFKSLLEETLSSLSTKPQIKIS